MADKRTENYFAAEEDPNKVASTLIEKSDSFFNVLRSNFWLDKLNRMWRAYYGAYTDDAGVGHTITFTGEQGELVQLNVNHFRNLAQHMYVMVTANRPSMQAKAINTDYKSQAQTYVANGVLEYYMREKRLEEYLKRACETAIVLGSGFVKLEWNATAGEVHDADPDTGEFAYEGELEFSTLSPLDVVVDGTKENWNDNEWVLTRKFVNRFNLIAKYPEFEDKIRAMPSKDQASQYRLGVWTNDQTDDIAVFEFFHKRTEAVPEGRYLLFLAGDIVLIDAKMPYRVIPVFRIAANEMLGTTYGYSAMFDVYPLQEMMNSLYSTMSTNANAFGVQNIFVPRGADINVNSLEGAMNIIEANAEPKPLNLLSMPPELFKLLELIKSDAETISGISSVTRGDPQASLKSGNALALVQSMSLQFISGLQQSYVKLIEDTGTALVQILKDFARAPKVVALVGKNNRPFLKEFTGEDISAINRVVVDVGNPLGNTLAGRVAMAEQMAQMKLLRSPEQYIQVMKTGNLDVALEGDMSELLLIKSENEHLLEGGDVVATAIDSHRLHIVEHKAVVADPDLRKDPALVKRVMDHIQAHIDLLRSTDPDLLLLVGEQPLNPPGQVPPDASMPGQDNPMAPGQGGNAELLGELPVEAGPGEVTLPTGQTQNLPSMPRPPAPFQDLPVTAQGKIPQ